MSNLERNLENRQWLFEKLKAEIIGPDPSGIPIAISTDSSTLLSKDQFWAPKKQINGEEIIWRSNPIKRYGAGILFPLGVTEEEQLADEKETGEETIKIEEVPDSPASEALEKKAEKFGKKRVEAEESDDYDVSLANSFRPSAMGVSFMADLDHAGLFINVTVEAAQYKPCQVRVGDDGEEPFLGMVWLRKPLKNKEGKNITVPFTKEKILKEESPIRVPIPGYKNNLQLVLLARNIKGEKASKKLITISLVNISKEKKSITENSFFQCGFKIESNKKLWICSYPEQECETLTHEDDKINHILYRNTKIFAIGHGCSADWNVNDNQMTDCVWTETLPTFETPSISAEFSYRGKPVRVSMRKLAGLDPEYDGWEDVDTLVKAYIEWISGLRKEIKDSATTIPVDLDKTAYKLIERCENCLVRIQKGIEYLKGESKKSKLALKAFQLANYAMLIAQLRASRDTREPFDDNGKLGWKTDFENPDPKKPHNDKGFWRPFQIAFVIMSILGICEPVEERKEREQVDLIWFPTGGGKTEAYLGLTAFTIFFNRISKLKPGGVDVLMRYTLRLLTAQQFQRATLLFCAMEHIRKQPKFNALLGSERFTLGMYVGGDSTPNTRGQAIQSLRKLNRDTNKENPFILLKCPWCNAKLGPLKKPINQEKVIGYREGSFSKDMPNSVIYSCRDPKCEFGYRPLSANEPLPVVLIDEDIFDNPPNLVIGTVDKFAMISWKPEVRSIFGINKDGFHSGIPPSLIIQDELHLISGPLGSMVGAYETVIENLCSNELFKPKIVASTATISRAREQVRSLYARDDIMLFPPSGLDADDSFFARIAKDENGNSKPGRLYAGVMAPAHGSLLTTQARIYAALLQFTALIDISDDDKSARDPWWTLLVFFNSLRELGGAATLLVTDARDYLRVIIDRHGIPYNKIRQLLAFEELTSRIRNDKIPEAIQKLEKSYDTDQKGYLKGTVEACLASNIIEVGVDIDRLSLMVIVGQPKTTSQYIQVSSRVGRSKEAPGLVVTAYSQSKPRDRSHFERFRSYHEKLYAQVEPTSVTPFSPPVVERALHALIVSLVRQTVPLSQSSSPRPFPIAEGSKLKKRIEKIILDRVNFIDEQEAEYVRTVLTKRLSEWQKWDPQNYGHFGAIPEDPPLMHPAGSSARPEWYGRSWSTPSSMRNVDATCEAEITKHY